MKILGLHVDNKILEYAISNGLTIFGLEAAKYPTAQKLKNKIEETLHGKFEIEEYPVPAPEIPPTHTDFNTMIQDMCKTAEKHPECTILPADQPPFEVGYLIYWTVGRKEKAIRFTIGLSDIRNISGKLLKLFQTPQGRAKICDVNTLRRMANE